MKLCETFIDCSVHLGNLFVAVGNDELSKKMASYTVVQKVFYSSDSVNLMLEAEVCFIEEPCDMV